MSRMETASLWWIVCVIKCEVIINVIFMNFANVIMLFIRIGKTRFRASTQIKQTKVFSA